MKKLPSWARLSPDEFQRRLQALQSVYTQNQLSRLLGISVRSINYYQKGASFPKSKEVYQNVNALYNQLKPKLTPEKVTQRKERQQKRSKAQEEGRLKWRTVPIYPDYMYESPASEFDGVVKWDMLETLSESGLVAGWYGRNAIPLEVHFVLHGERDSRFGKVVNIVGIFDKSISPKEDNGYTGQQVSLEILPVYYRFIGLKKEDDFGTRLDKIRGFFDGLDIDKYGFPHALFGYYFNEDDEL